MKTKVFIVFMIFLYGCNNSDLGNHYYYRSKDDAIDMGGLMGAIIYKSPQEDLIRNIVISASVEECISNRTFALVYQKPDKESLRHDMVYMIEIGRDEYAKGNSNFVVPLPGKTSLPATLYRNKNATFIADSLLNSDMYRKAFLHTENYWIIDIKRDSVLGPLTRGDYRRLRSELGIPESLRLKAEH